MTRYVHYFIKQFSIGADSLGTLNTLNNQLGQTVFYPGKYNRTYVLYMSDRFMAKITYYDIGQGARPAVLNLTLLRGEHTIYCGGTNLNHSGNPHKPTPISDIACGGNI